MQRMIETQTEKLEINISNITDLIDLLNKNPSQTKSVLEYLLNDKAFYTQILNNLNDIALFLEELKKSNTPEVENYKRKIFNNTIGLIEKSKFYITNRMQFLFALQTFPNHRYVILKNFLQNFINNGMPLQLTESGITKEATGPRELLLAAKLLAEKNDKKFILWCSFAQIYSFFAAIYDNDLTDLEQGVFITKSLYEVTDDDLPKVQKEAFDLLRMSLLSAFPLICETMPHRNSALCEKIFEIYIFLYKLEKRNDQDIPAIMRDIEAKAKENDLNGAIKLIESSFKDFTLFSRTSSPIQVNYGNNELFLKATQTKGDGWCLLRAIGEPIRDDKNADTDAVRSLNKLLDSLKSDDMTPHKVVIIHRLSMCFRDSLYSGQIPCTAFSAWKDGDENNIGKTLEKLIEACHLNENASLTDSNPQQQNLMHYLERPDVLKAYIEYYMSKKYVSLGIASAILAMNDKQLFLISSHSSNGQYSALAEEGLEVWKENKANPAIVFVLFNAAGNYLTDESYNGYLLSHYTQLTLMNVKPLNLEKSLTPQAKVS